MFHSFVLQSVKMVRYVESVLTLDWVGGLLICISNILNFLGKRCEYHDKLNIQSKTLTKRPELNSVPVASAVRPKKYMKPAGCRKFIFPC